MIGPAPTSPAQFAANQWSISNLATGGDARITISTLPDNGGSAITDLEYQIDGGSWVSLGGTTSGNYDLANAFTDGVAALVAIRAVNAIGNGTASSTKSITTTASGVSISTFISDPVEAARRMTYAGNHNLGTSQEMAFTGFSASDEAGMTVVQVTSASGLSAALTAAAADANGRIVELDWDGDSAFTAGSCNGPHSSTLTANGSVDYGYNRWGSKVLVRPATGRSPVIKYSALSTSHNMYGFEWLEFRDITTDGVQWRFSATATYPSLAIFAANGCTFKNANGTYSTSENGVLYPSTPLRTLHVENCTFDHNRAGMVGGAQTRRVWNCKSINALDNDFIGDRGYPDSLCSTWTVRSWIAGNVVHNAHQTEQNASGLHPDFYQVSVTTANSNAPAREILIEFNYAHFNRSPDAAQTQGIFGDDGTYGDFAWVVHNNVFAIGAYNAMMPYDPDDSSPKYLGNNLCLRQGNGGGTSGGSYQDSYPWIRGLAVNAGNGSGYLKVVRNRAKMSSWADQGADNVTLTGNRELRPDLGASYPDRYTDQFEGSGGGAGFVTNVHPAGHMTYDTGELATDTNAQVIAKMRAFFTPKGSSWPTDSSTDFPVDPNLWPMTDPTSIAA